MAKKKKRLHLLLKLLAKLQSLLAKLQSMRAKLLKKLLPLLTKLLLLLAKLQPLLTLLLAPLLTLLLPLLPPSNSGFRNKKTGLRAGFFTPERRANRQGCRKRNARFPSSARRWFARLWSP
ncbi:MAG: hypothetical protein ACYCY9_07555 [Thiobacillus sp.]